MTSLASLARRLLGVFAWAIATSACAGAPSGSSDGARSHLDASARASALAEGLRYKVDVDKDATEVRVEAKLPPGSAPELGVDTDAQPFVRDVAIERAGVFEPIERRGRSWIVPSCEQAGCTLRYRFLLGEAAEAIDDYGIASEHLGVRLSPPSSWLLRPLGAAQGAEPYRFRVTAPPGVSFVTGVFPAEDGEPDTYGADLTDLPDAPFSAFGVMKTSLVRIPGGEVELAIVPGELGEDDSVIQAWVANAAESVASYYGGFPIRRALVIVLPTMDGGVGFARTLGNGGASIVVPLGRDAHKDDLDDDWVMTHEMVHLAFPNMPRRHLWLEEGLATYIEPIARARLGKLTPERVWRDLIRGLPKGLPGPDDQGLDNTPTWGRTYWGGALFCLLADIEIREQTGGRKSLDDALRAIVRAGGTIAARWPLEKALDAGDKATGVTVLRELHTKMGLSPAEVDLRGLFARLGVRMIHGQVTFDDGAELAGIRRAITSPPSSTAGAEHASR